MPPATSVFREAGLSRPKQRALLAVAEAVRDGLDLDHLCRLDADDAIGAMTAVPGIGPWTAEVYLLFAAGHPDIFPARDVALQTRGRPCARHRPASGREGADQDRRIMVAVAGRRVAAVLGLLSRNQRQGRARRLHKPPKKAEIRDSFAGVCATQAASHSCHLLLTVSAPIGSRAKEVDRK